MSILKGQIIGLIVIMAMISFLIGNLFSITLSTSTFSTVIMAKEIRILASLDQIEAIKIGTKFMLNFSFQQGLYEHGKRGGYLEEYYNYLTKKNLLEEEYPVWRNYSKNIFLVYLSMPNLWYPYPVFEDRLKVSIWNYTIRSIDKYREDLRNKFGIDLRFLGYNIQDIENKNILEGLWFINYTEEFFTINDINKDKIDVSHILNDYLKMIDFANQTFLQEDKVRDSMISSIDSLDQNCKIIELEFCELEQVDTNPNLLLNLYCPNVLEKLNESVRNNIEKLSSNYDSFSLNLKVNKTEIKYTFDQDFINLGEDRNCGCKEMGQKYELGIECSGNEKEYCSNLGYYSGFCDTKGNIVCYDCNRYYIKQKVITSYKYYVASKVLVNLTTKELYPLYEEKEGKVILRPITLKFSVISSSDYSWNPIL